MAVRVRVAGSGTLVAWEVPWPDISLTEERLLSAVSPLGDMVGHARSYHTCQSSHGAEIRCRLVFSGKNDEPTPDFPTPDFPRLPIGYQHCKSEQPRRLNKDFSVEWPGYAACASRQKLNLCLRR